MPDSNPPNDFIATQPPHQNKRTSFLQALIAMGLTSPFNVVLERRQIIKQLDLKKSPPRTLRYSFHNVLRAGIYTALRNAFTGNQGMFVRASVSGQVSRSAANNSHKPTSQTTTDASQPAHNSTARIVKAIGSIAVTETTLTNPSFVSKTLYASGITLNPANRRAMSRLWSLGYPWRFVRSGFSATTFVLSTEYSQYVRQQYGETAAHALPTVAGASIAVLTTPLEVAVKRQISETFRNMNGYVWLSQGYRFHAGDLQPPSATRIFLEMARKNPRALGVGAGYNALQNGILFLGLSIADRVTNKLTSPTQQPTLWRP